MKSMFFFMFCNKYQNIFDEMTGISKITIVSMDFSIQGQKIINIPGEELKMRKLLKSLSTLTAFLALTLGVGYSLTQSNDMVGAKAAEQTIFLDNLGANLTTTANTSILTTDINGFNLNYLQGKKQTSSKRHAILMVNSTGSFISNNTQIPGVIKSVDVEILSGASGTTTYYCHFAETEFLSAGTGGTAVNISVASSYTFVNSDNASTYFSISLGNNKNGQVVSLSINYEESATPTPHDSAQSFADWIMSFEGGDVQTAQCEDKFLEAFMLWDELSTEAQNLIKTDNEFTEVLARYSNWAAANGQTIDGENVNPARRVASQSNRQNSISLIVLIGLLGATSIIGYYGLNKKKLY